MKDKYTHISVILDASGSMSGVEASTKTTMSNFIEEQKQASGETTMSIYQFDDESKIILNFQDLSKMKNNPMDAYVIGGCTALYDTICDAIDQTGAHLAAMDEANRPSTVIVAILTDGYENASRRFDINDVKTKIQHQTDVYNWKFLFLAANQDAVLTGGRIGIQKNSCVSTFTETDADMKDNVRMMAEACYCLREPHENLDMENIREKVRSASLNPRYRMQSNTTTNSKNKKTK